MIRDKPNAKEVGTYIIIGGLATQLLFFGYFMLVSLVFYRRIVAAPTKRSHSSHAPHIPWRKHLFVVYAASLLIMLRSVFRVVEYVQGSDGYLLRNEIWLYIFDGALMLAMMILLNLAHPSEINALLTGQKAATMGFRMLTVERLSDDDLGKSGECRNGGHVIV
jgi:RTA1 like protein